MRLHRPTPESWPVLYTDDGTVIDDPNKLNKTQEKAVAEAAAGRAEPSQLPYGLGDSATPTKEGS